MATIPEDEIVEDETGDIKEDGEEKDSNVEIFRKRIMLRFLKKE